jgi:hypothetical protein
VITKDNKYTPTKESRDIIISSLKEEEKEILEILKGLKGWRYDEADDLSWLREFTQEFPEFELSLLRACRDYHSGMPPPKQKGAWKKRLRNWMIKEREFQRKPPTGPRGKSYEQWKKEQEGRHGT